MKKLKEKLGAKLKKKNGFTLIEMLVVVAIIVILVLVSIPMVNSSLEKARVATDKANLRAAKAVAMIECLNDKTVNAQYYDIEKGALVTNKPTGYGQSKDYKGGVIKVSVTPATETKDAEVTCEWEMTSTTTP